MIILGFSKPNKFKVFSFLIMLILGIKFSHVYLKFFDDYTGKWIIFEASHGEVHLIDEPNWRESNIAVREESFEIDDKHKREVIRFMISNLQKPYSISNIFAILIYQVFKVKINFLFDGPHAFICSELVALALDNKISFKKPLDLVTPKDIWDAV